MTRKPRFKFGLHSTVGHRARTFLGPDRAHVECECGWNTVKTGRGASLFAFVEHGDHEMAVRAKR